MLYNPETFDFNSGKYFFYIKAQQVKKYQFISNYFIDIEKYIAVMSNNRTAFDENGQIS